MSSHERQPPGSNAPGGGGGVSLITRVIIEAYLNGRFKGYLKPIGQTGSPSGHEALMEGVRQEFRHRAPESLVRRYRDEEIRRGPAITHSILGTELPLILVAVVENGEFSPEFDALKRADAPAGQAKHHDVPIPVFDGEEVGKEHRQVLLAGSGTTLS